MAVKNACETLRERLAPYYEKFRNQPFKNIVTAAYLDRVNLSAQGFYRVPYIGYTFGKDGKGYYKFLIYRNWTTICLFHSRCCFFTS